MAFFSRNVPKIPHEAPRHQRKELDKKLDEEKPEESFFGKKGYLTRLQLREKLRKDTGKIPGSAKWYTRRERESIEKESFGKDYGEYITPQEYHYRIKQLNKDKFKAKSAKEKLDIDRKIRYLKKLGGV